MNLSAKGQNGTTVSFDGRFVTITRGMMSGQGRGEKRIATGSINAVQFKKAGKLGRGFISFTVGGGDEKASKIGGQIQSAWKDENSAVFLSTSNADFEAIRDAVEAAMTAPTASPTASASKPRPPPAPATDRKILGSRIHLDRTCGSWFSRRDAAQVSACAPVSRQPAPTQ